MLNYEKSERYYYYNMVPTQIVLNNRFRMLGIMGTDHHPNVKVSILPERSSDMFVGMDLSTKLPKPRTKLYENTIRFQLPYFLSLAPDYLLDQAHRVRYSHFKTKAKEYIIDRYSTLCTSVGCRVCHFNYTR